MKIHQVTNLRDVWTTGDLISQNIYQVYEPLDLQSCSLEDKLDPNGSAIFSLSTTSSVVKCWEKGLGKKTVHHLCDYVLVIAFQIITQVEKRRFRFRFCNGYLTETWISADGIVTNRCGKHVYPSCFSFTYLELASFLTAVNALSFLRFFSSPFWSFYRFPFPEYGSAVKPLLFHIP